MTRDRDNAAEAMDPELDALLGADSPVGPEDRAGAARGGGAGARSPLFWKLALATIALTWGFSFFMMKDILGLLPTYRLLAVRFDVAALLMLILFRKRVAAHLNRRNIVVGAGIGFVLWIAYAAQTLGLAQTTAGKNAFLTGTYCVLVPFASYLLMRERLTRYNVGAAFMCLAGIGLVALDSMRANTGDVLTLAGAAFFALQISLIAKFGRDLDVNVITFWMFLAVGILSTGSSCLFERDAWLPPSQWTPGVVGTLAFLSVCCTCLALLVQNVALAHVPSSTGSLLLSLESPSGVFFSVVMTGEALTPRLLAGFALIFLSIVLSETHFDFLRGRRKALA